MSIPRCLAVVLTVATAATASAATTSSTTLAASAGSPRATVVKLTNEERAKAGCSGLNSDGALGRAAQRHSTDMAKNDFVGHRGSRGSTMETRAEDAGYSGWKSLAENVAAGQKSPAEVVRSWMESPDHRANILNCALTHIGVGYVRRSGTDHDKYWTQDFGAKG
ncbi:CAP domain-containing protein [Streptomyces sp. NPDC058653]|uniref:CAP domain-containing protein n=1 Tax=Streptomyces sp. NPDC058653 TaxID=3346576 RepID=UPI003664870A